jgi:hypothetical protein
MFAVRSPIAPLLQCVLGIKRRCIKLIATACDSYRPERHYMRGPGPKWFAKHGVVPIGGYVEHGKLGLTGRQIEKSLLTSLLYSFVAASRLQQRRRS